MSTEANTLANRTVLVADDDPIMRELLASMLGAAGLQVVGEAWNAERAIELYRKIRPDFVCLDIGMPGQGGLEALTSIRALDPGAIVLVISAETTAENVQRARDSGASGIIAKPLNAQRLASELRRALAKGPSPEMNLGRPPDGNGSTE